MFPGPADAAASVISLSALRFTAGVHRICSGPSTTLGGVASVAHRAVSTVGRSSAMKIKEAE